MASQNVPVEEIKMEENSEPRNRSEVDGKTRIIPIPKWKAEHNNAMKKVRRLAEKVDKLSREKGFPPMGFFYIHGGQINVYGHQTACEEIFSERNLSNLDPGIMEPNVQCSPEETEEEKKTIDLRKIDLEIDYRQVKVDDLRQCYSLMLFNKGKGERSTYTDSKIPDFWPHDVPFVSHSKRRDDGKRVLTSEMMVRCLESFKDYCIEKIKMGYTPVNAPTSLNLEKFETIPDKINMMEEDESADKMQEPPEETRGETEVEESTDENDNDEKKYKKKEEEDNNNSKDLFDDDDEPMEEGDPRSLLDYLIEGNELTPEILMGVKSTGLYNKAAKVDFQPRKKLLRSYNGPKHLIPGEGQLSFWNVINEFPDVARINLFLFATEHLSHYCCQYEACETSVELLKTKFDSPYSKANNIKELLLEETKHLLTDEKPSLSTWMFFSGYLKATVVIYREAGNTSYISACPCLEGDRQSYEFFQDKGETVYPLSQKSLWCANKLNTRRVDVEDEVLAVEDEPQGTLPGIEVVNRNLSRYGYTVYQDDIDRITNGEWLDDSVVNLCIRHLLECHQTDFSNGRNMAMLDSTFARKLLVAKQATCLDDGSKLKFSVVNFQDGEVYTRRLNLDILDLVIIPICDNLHWFSVYFLPKAKVLQYICSMGGRGLKVMKLLRRVMNLATEHEISFEHPQVPKQANGNDCGIYAILFAESMIKKGQINNQQKFKRQQVLKIIKDVEELND